MGRDQNYFLRNYVSRKICLKFSTCDLYCGCEKRGALPPISRMRVPACIAYGSLGATGGSMAKRRCSYTAAFKLKLAERLHVIIMNIT